MYDDDEKWACDTANITINWGLVSSTGTAVLTVKSVLVCYKN